MLRIREALLLETLSEEFKDDLREYDPNYFIGIDQNDKLYIIKETLENVKKLGGE